MKVVENRPVPYNRSDDTTDPRPAGIFTKPLTLVPKIPPPTGAAR